MVEKGKIELRHCDIHDQAVDVFTKGVVEYQFLKLRNSIVSPISMNKEYVR